MSSDRHHVLKAWIAAILIVIAIESSALLSSHNTSRILYPLLHFLFGMNHARFEHWHVYIRKGGHVFGYGLLSILLFRAWRDTFPFPGSNWSMQWARISFFMSALVACLDEWHQTYLPSRTGNLHDVLLDSTAALIAQLVLFLILRRRVPESSPQLKIS